MKKYLTIAVLALACSIPLFVNATKESGFLLERSESTIYYNGELQEYNLPVITIDGHTYVPLRETAENLGLDIDWSEESNKIEVTSPEKIFEKLTGFVFPETASILNYDYRKADAEKMQDPQFCAKIRISASELAPILNNLQEFWIKENDDINPNDFNQFYVPNMQYENEQYSWWDLESAKDALYVYERAIAGMYVKTTYVWFIITEETTDSYIIYLMG